MVAEEEGFEPTLLSVDYQRVACLTCGDIKHFCSLSCEPNSNKIDLRHICIFENMIKSILILPFLLCLISCQNIEEEQNSGENSESKRIEQDETELSNLLSSELGDDYDPELIQESIRKELREDENSKWFKYELNAMITLLDNPDSLFPYQAYDSAHHVFYGSDNDIEIGKWNEVYSEYEYDRVKLSADQEKSILAVINNPMNFSWGECGTPFISRAIIFYNSGNEIARIEFACSGGQIFTIPENPLIRFGSLTEQGDVRLYQHLE